MSECFLTHLLVEMRARMGMCLVGEALRLYRGFQEPSVNPPQVILPDTVCVNLSASDASASNTKWMHIRSCKDLKLDMSPCTDAHRYDAMCYCW